MTTDLPPDLGLGRHEAPDHRDTGFRAAEAPPRHDVATHAAITRGWRYWWSSGWWGDQGATSQCVAYSWLHLLEDGPVTFAPRKPGSGPLADPQAFYDEAQTLDEWPGIAYDGTSVRAGAKVAQRHGHIGTYLWAWNVESVVDCLLTKGPVVAGTTWLVSMFWPRRDGRLTVDPASGEAGGHAYKLDGVNTHTRTIRVKNSWSRSWGRGGFAYVTYDDLAWLLSHGGECCMPTELRHT